MDILIKNALTVLPDKTVPASVYIKNGVIAGIDKCPENFKAEKTIDGTNKLLIPGLINAHSHAYMTVFRNCADDLSFADWLFGKIQPAEDKLTGEDCYWSTKLGCVEMLSTGTVAYYDMGMFMEEAAQACIDTGIHGILSRGLSGAPDCPEEPNPRLQQGIDLWKHWHDNDNITVVMGPHAPYSCTESYLKQSAETAKEYDMPISIHLSESAGEMESVKEQYGCTPIELADRCGLLTDRTVIAHCVYATDDDISLLAERKSSVAANPISNMKLANGFAPITKMVRAGVNVCIGTDGSSSNNALNMFRDMAALALIHKGNEHDPLALTAPEILKMATVNGAKAFGLKNMGEIREGYRADLAILDLNRPNMRPNNNPVSALCYSASGFETETVIVNGKICLENGQPVNVDMEEIYAHMEEICDRIGVR